MKVDAKCKFCGTALKLTIDDDYYNLGDPMKLIQLAACNRCADLRVERRQLTDALLRLVGILIGKEFLEAKGKVMTDEERNEIRFGIRRITQKYCGLVSDWKNKPETNWSEQVVTDIMEQPNELGRVLKQLWA